MKILSDLGTISLNYILNCSDDIQPKVHKLFLFENFARKQFL